MSDPHEAEALVVLAPSSLTDGGPILPAVRVAHVLPPRLAIVQGPRPELEALAALDGIDQVLFEDASPPAGLDSREQLFVNAWLLGRQPKERPGEGLAWDAPGRLPPDPPPGRLPPQPPRRPD